MVSSFHTFSLEVLLISVIGYIFFQIILIILFFLYCQTMVTVTKLEPKGLDEENSRFECSYLSLVRLKTKVMGLV